MQTALGFPLRSAVSHDLDLTYLLSICVIYTNNLKLTYPRAYAHRPQIIIYESRKIAMDHKATRSYVDIGLYETITSFALPNTFSVQFLCFLIFQEKPQELCLNWTVIKARMRFRRGKPLFHFDYVIFTRNYGFFRSMRYSYKTTFEILMLINVNIPRYAKIFLPLCIITTSWWWEGGRSMSHDLLRDPVN